MKRNLGLLYWGNFIIVLFIPFVLVVSAKTKDYAILENTSYWVQFWLAASLIFLVLSTLIGIKIKRTGAGEENIARSKSNRRDMIFILALSLLGTGLGLSQKGIPENHFWNILIIYWIIFTFSIVRIMGRFMSQCRDEKILS